VWQPCKTAIHLLLTYLLLLTYIVGLYRHDVQITVMFVGGPNERLDFHLEHGEEVFNIFF